jgi:hypothetical protein
VPPLRTLPPSSSQALPVGLGDLGAHLRHDDSIAREPSLCRSAKYLVAGLIDYSNTMRHALSLSLWLRHRSPDRWLLMTFSAPQPSRGQLCTTSRVTRPAIFISHVHADRGIAEILQAELDRTLLGGATFFNALDRASLRPGDPWRDRILETLGASAVVLVVASPRSVLSPWVNFRERWWLACQSARHPLLCRRYRTVEPPCSAWTSPSS